MVHAGSNWARSAGSADEHVAHEKRLPGIRGDESHRQPVPQVGPTEEVLDEYLPLVVQVLLHAGQEELEVLRRHPLVLFPPDLGTRPGSSTTNLSFGLRPVCGEVMAVKAPRSLSTPPPAGSLPRSTRWLPDWLERAWA
jgi:hypothetical protein